LRLSQNQIRLQLAQAIGIDSIDRQALSDDLFHPLVNLIRRIVHRNFRRAVDRKLFDAAREIAFVGTANEILPATQCGRDFGRAGEE
jgi:hypothetical protein